MSYDRQPCIGEAGGEILQAARKAVWPYLKEGEPFFCPRCYELEGFEHFGRIQSIKLQATCARCGRVCPGYVVEVIP